MMPLVRNGILLASGRPPAAAHANECGAPWCPYRDRDRSMTFAVVGPRGCGAVISIAFACGFSRDLARDGAQRRRDRRAVGLIEAERVCRCRGERAREHLAALRTPVLIDDALH